jgi:hypothetical protein
MMVIRAHYDGKVIVPNEPVDLPRGRELLFHVDESAATRSVVGVSGKSLLHFSGAMAADDVQQMTQAIAEGCEQINTDEW